MFPFLLKKRHFPFKNQPSMLQPALHNNSAQTPQVRPLPPLHTTVTPAHTDTHTHTHICTHAHTYTHTHSHTHTYVPIKQDCMQSGRGEKRETQNESLIATPRASTVK